MLLDLGENKLLVASKLFRWVSLSKADLEGQKGILEEILN